MNNATPVQKLLLAVGVIVLLGGLVCVVVGFTSFASSDVSETDSAPMLFAAGGFAMVVGFGLFAFTRAAVLTRSGDHVRVTIEQGRTAGGRFCSRCGQPVAPAARFCESCGHAVG